MSQLYPAVYRRTDVTGRVGFLPGCTDDAGRLVRYVPLPMSEARALAVARLMCDSPAKAPVSPSAAPLPPDAAPEPKSAPQEQSA